MNHYYYIQLLVSVLSIVCIKYFSGRFFLSSPIYKLLYVIVLSVRLSIRLWAGYFSNILTQLHPVFGIVLLIYFPGRFFFSNLLSFMSSFCPSVHLSGYLQNVFTIFDSKSIPIPPKVSGQTRNFHMWRHFIGNFTLLFHILCNRCRINQETIIFITSR